MKSFTKSITNRWFSSLNFAPNLLLGDTILYHSVSHLCRFVASIIDLVSSILIGTFSFVNLSVLLIFYIRLQHRIPKASIGTYFQFHSQSVSRSHIKRQFMNVFKHFLLYCSVNLFFLHGSLGPFNSLFNFLRTTFRLLTEETTQTLKTKNLGYVGYLSKYLR